jgi:uncharacterized membrane protein
MRFISTESEAGVVGDYLPESLERTADEVMQGAPFKFHKKIDIDKAASLLDEPINSEQRKFVHIPMAIYSPIPYIPQAIGISMAKLFNLPVLLTMYLGRLLNLLAWITLVYAAIRTIPVFKYVLTLIALTPMSLFLSASLSADSLTNALSFLLVAFVLRCAFDENKVLKKHDIILLIVLSVLIALCKQAYFMLIFLYLLIPVKKFDSAKGYYGAFALMVIMALAASSYWSNLVRGFDYVNIYCPYRDKLSSADQLQFIMHHPLEFIGILLDTLVKYNFYIPSFVGILGWLDAPLPRSVSLIYFLLLIYTSLCDKVHGISLNRRNRLIMLGLWLIVFSMIMTFFYLTWTPVGEDEVYAVCGRYFIPIALLFFFVFYNDSKQLLLNPLTKFIMYALITISLLTADFEIIYRYYGEWAPPGLVFLSLMSILILFLWKLSFLEGAKESVTDVWTTYWKVVRKKA